MSTIAQAESVPQINSEKIQQNPYKRYAGVLIIVLIAIVYLVAFTNEIENGKYLADVSYTNFGTGYQAKYTLYVTIKSDRVVHIYFPKGGSLHSGSNNHGYAYSGGELSPVFGSIYAGTVQVVTAKGDFLQYYVQPNTTINFDS